MSAASDRETDVVLIGAGDPRQREAEEDAPTAAGMRALQDDGERRTRCRCEIEDSERFIRPEELSGHDVPAEAAGLP